MRLIRPGIAGCAWLSLLKAADGLLQSCRGMGLLRSPSQASQLLHGSHSSWEVYVTCGKPFSYGAGAFLCARDVALWRRSRSANPMWMHERLLYGSWPCNTKAAPSAGW